jgi:DNA polymerase III delta prime subunit
MFDLKDHLEPLHELDDLRTRVKELREQGLRSLRGIKRTEILSTGAATLETEESDKDFYNEPKWVCSGNEAEVALVVKVQNHHNMWERDEDNDKATAGDKLTERLTKITLKVLFPEPDPHSRNADATVPVLVAARALQALAARAETVFSRASMLCYYRIVREFYYAAAPDWTIGAARAGSGGRPSAFITGECIRAVFAFESAIRRTSEYFEHTRAFYKRYLQLKAMLEYAGLESDLDHPLSEWADKAIERMWLDWYISTNPRNGAVALYCEGTPTDVLPFPPRQIEPGEVNMRSVGEAFRTLKDKLTRSIENAFDGIKEAREEIEDGRWNERDDLKKDRTESAFRKAHHVICNIQDNASHAESECRKAGGADDPLKTLLDKMQEKFKGLPAEIHRVLEPSKRYVRTVLDRELGVAHSGRGFDAGELIFAATALGAATNWLENEKLIQACDFLVRALPDSGRFTTSRPFHATVRGYKLLPIGCEMTRSFAKLLHRTRYEFDPPLARKMLNIFLNDKQYFPPAHGESQGRAGWNFESAPDADQPYVWVTAISVQALDRFVRMLNDRINEIVFKHFKVIRPEKPHTNLTLNDLIYPDYGLSGYYKNSTGSTKEITSIAIRLEQMRAHVMRASLPKKYKEDKDGNKEKVSSAILYGPPGTGKTSLLEALALSSGVPLVMLSPSDLIVQGQEHLEGRARAVFDALSMLSQVVILLDEFEPILRRREPKPEKDDIDSEGDTTVGGGLNVVAKAIREGGASMLKFLVTGMLPKLVSLHDAAEKRSLVYCLATNHLEEIDDAAKRGGRFDVRQPIYNPDPLSRAGTFLFRLQPLARGMDVGDRLSGIHKQPVFARIIVATANENAGELSRRFFKQPKKNSQGKYVLSPDEKKRSFFAYALGEGVDAPEVFDKRARGMTEKNFETMGREFEAARDRLDGSDDELNERGWLFDFENKLKEICEPGTERDFLNSYLSYDGER